MGLDTTHNCWHGSYSGFGNWRNELAMLTGYGVTEVLPGLYAPAIGEVSNAEAMGAWPATPADPLIVLFAHSDCEGEIKVPQLYPLARRLEGIYGEHGARMAPPLRAQTRRFIDGLYTAHLAGQPVGFH